MLACPKAGRSVFACVCHIRAMPRCLPAPRLGGASLLVCAVAGRSLFGWLPHGKAQPLCLRAPRLAVASLLIRYVAQTLHVLRNNSARLFEDGRQRCAEASAEVRTPSCNASLIFTLPSSLILSSHFGRGRGPRGGSRRVLQGSSADVPLCLQGGGLHF